MHDKLVSGRMVPQEISLEEKRVHVPTLMTQEPFFFSIPVAVAAASTVSYTVVTTPVVSSPVATTNKNQEPAV